MGVKSASVYLWSLVIFLILASIESKDGNATTKESEFIQYSSGQGSEIISEEITGDDVYPTVNKCCPFYWSYENGKCVKAGGNKSSEDSELPVQEAPKTVVTLAKDFQSFNMTDILGDPVVFRLNVGQPNCSSAKFEIAHHELKPVTSSVDSVLALSPEGYLLWSDESGYVHQVSDQDFCIDKSQSAYVAVLCTPICDESHICVRKCCQPDSVLFNETCMHSTKPWEPHLYSSPGQRANASKTPPHFVIGVPNNCEKYAVSLRDEPSSKAYLLLNGTLVVEYIGKKSYHDPDRFCLDGSATLKAAYSGEGLDYLDHYQLVHYSGHELDQTAIICYPPGEDLASEPEDWRLMLYGCTALISSFFLFLTALVYVILWEYQNIHGWLQFCYVLSLLFAFTFLAIVQLSSSSIESISVACCKGIGALIHFLFLSAFFWLTSMNFDLWWTFSGCRPLRTSSLQGEKKRFFCFSLFSYGLPSLIAGTGLVLDSLFRDDPNIITPRFGERNCYFFGDKELLPYFYGPVGFLLTVNSVFFISTIYSLHKLQNDTKFATKQSSKQEKKRFLLFMKLFVVMGVLWIFEAISWATGMLNPQQHQFIKNIFLPTDLLNAAQGVAIFIIFACKPNTCRQLESQFKKFSAYLEEKREQGSTSNTSFMKVGQIVAGICIIIIPIVNRLRKLLGFCCHITRSLEGRRHMSHTNTITSTIWDKSRKVSDTSSSATVFSHVEMELDMTSPSSYPQNNFSNIPK